MSTLTATYCAVCDLVATVSKKLWNGFLAYAEAVGTARAAAELTRQGYYKEAKALYCKGKED